jgi:hypothetical protein
MATTYPTTPAQPVGRPCYTCVHLYDVAPAGQALCMRSIAPGRPSVQANPEGGCVYWLRDPSAPIINTRAEWVAVHGPGLTGFTERSERRFRPPMTTADARAAAARGDATALAWEAALLHDILRRTVDALHAMRTRIELELLRQDVVLLRQLIAAEHPVAQEHLRQQAVEPNARRC